MLGISQIVQKCTIRETWNERGHICLIFQKLSKSRQALKFRLKACTGCERWQTLTTGTKLAPLDMKLSNGASPRGKQVVNSGNTKPPRGRSWFKSWPPLFFGMYNLLPFCFAQTSVDLKLFETLNPLSCMWLRRLFLLTSYP